MEFGVGIHGEPGRYREKIDYSTGTFADDLARRILTDLEEDLGLKAGEDVVLLINGFGGTPLQELYLLNNSVTKAITADGINVHRTIVGNFMTSIDMAGASISVLRVDSELKALVDYPVSTPALTWGAAMSEQAEAALEAIKAIGKALGYTPAEPAKKASKKAVAEAEDDNATYEVEGTPVVTETINTAAFVQIVDKMADVIIENEVPFCEADQMGDGDFGMSIAKGFKQLKADWATRKKGDVGEFLVSCSEIIKEYCGGASGPIWGSAFKYAGKAMLGKKEINLTDLAFLFMEANRGVYETGKKSFGKGADIGDKTLVDALKPCALALTKAAEEGKALREGIDLGAKAAHEGAEATKTHVATLGRAGTVGERSIGFPDAGAHGLDVIFNELAAYIKTL